MSKVPGLDWFRRRFGRTPTVLMNDVARINVPQWMDPQKVLRKVRAKDFDGVDGVVIEAEIDRYAPDALSGVRRIIDDNYRLMPTLLVGIDYSTRGLQEAAEVFDATLAVSPDEEERIGQLEPHYPKLLGTVGRFGNLGSVRMNTFPLVDESVLQRRMRNEIGDQFHDLADQAFPEFYAYRAPGSYANAAENVLGDMGREVVSRQHTNLNCIEVFGFVFDIDEAHLPEEGLRDPLGGNESVQDGVSPASILGGESGGMGAPGAPDDDGSSDQVVHRDLGGGEGQS